MSHSLPTRYEALELLHPCAKWEAKGSHNPIVGSLEKSISKIVEKAHFCPILAQHIVMVQVSMWLSYQYWDYIAMTWTCNVFPICLRWSCVTSLFHRHENFTKYETNIKLSGLCSLSATINRGARGKDKRRNSREPANPFDEYVYTTRFWIKLGSSFYYAVVGAGNLTIDSISHLNYESWQETYILVGLGRQHR